ncbi:hypothetical protein [Chelativorans xinjiangense]|uniref:hypothetical protein n=1 Tax=Chelativorans xinjiangense TaxID=2681485 RepID=UPI00135CBC2C|nr:hypothetical protein [Chelativorans xinjiangense]
MGIMFHDALASLPDLRHRLRQWRWFRVAFRKNAEQVRSAFGIRYEIDDVKLARAFFNWLEALERARPYAGIARPDVIVFGAGAVLCELLREHPARHIAGSGRKEVPEDLAETAEIAHFWPEGFLYTSFCISGIMTIYEQEFGKAKPLAACVDEIRFWWSFKENVADMPAMAIPFLDRIVGQEPNWMMPAAVTDRLAIRGAMRDAPGGGGSGAIAGTH